MNLSAPKNMSAGAPGVSDAMECIPHPSRRAVCALLLAGLLLVGCGFAGSAAGQEDEPSAKSAAKSAAQKPQAKAKNEADEADDKDPAKNNPRQPENPFPNRFKAPELEGGSEWLNTGGEITLKDLKGKVVLLDFWTYCCINCMHILPDLKFLEQKYPNELVVIGVHSAKFDNEKETENIRRAIVRYEIEHPVINDSEMTVWRKFGVRSWPTLVLIDPEGQYCGYVSGEGQRELLDAVVEKLAAYHRAKGTLDETPVNFSLERTRVVGGALKFPGKLIADAGSSRLFISDSNHNRIVIADAAGKLQETIGTGAIGRDDGDFDKASFDHPQGLAFDAQRKLLYIADTENHQIRMADLAQRKVTTLAGLGMQGHERFQGGPGLKTALNSPWDLYLHPGPEAEEPGVLFIAMAGPHQIWTLDLATKEVQPYAGSGREDVTNGALRMASEPGADSDPGDFQRISAFAQPSGLASDGKSLFVVDSEGSSIRQVPLNGTGKVKTIAGTSDLPGGQSLFAFGDKDGKGGEARFQHPLGIAYQDGRLFVADSYNHKIKSIDPKTGDVRTLYGDGKPGAGDDPLRFSEPAGLAILGEALFVADTNNHLIRKVDLQSGAASTLTIEGLSAPTPPRFKSTVPEVEPLEVPALQVAAQGTLPIELSIELPEGYKLNPELAPSFRVKTVGDAMLVQSDALEGKQEAELVAGTNRIRLSLPLLKEARRGELLLTVSFGYCRAGIGGLCKIKTLAWKIPVEIDSRSTSKTLALEATVE